MFILEIKFLLFQIADEPHINRSNKGWPRPCLGSYNLKRFSFNSLLLTSRIFLPFRRLNVITKAVVQHLMNETSVQVGSALGSLVGVLTRVES